MKSSENEQNEENPGNDEEHTPIQRRIIKEVRELIEKGELDPIKNEKSRTKILDMFQWEASQIEGENREQLEQTITA